MSVKQVKVIPTNKNWERRVERHGSVWNIISENDHTGRILAQSINATARGPSGTLEHELIWLNRGEFIRL